VTCTFTNSKKPTLKIVKHILGESATFNFGVVGSSPWTPSLTPPNNGSADTGVHEITPGAYTVSELTPLPAEFTLTDVSCTEGNAGPLDGNGIPTNWQFNADYGDAIVCTFVNSSVKTTRTQGFWATHTTLANNVWNGIAGLPGETPLGADVYLCDPTTPITAIAAEGQNQLMGGFWANIANMTTDPKKREDLDRARMQMLQQYLAAVLNVHAFGSGSLTLLSNARSAYCSGDIKAIKAQIGILGSFNSSGDSLPFTPGASATPSESRFQANIPFWNVTIH